MGSHRGIALKRISGPRQPAGDFFGTATHKTLLMGSKVRVKNLSNGRSEQLTITDRGPYIKGRIIDVSIGSEKRLGFDSKGLTRVKEAVLKRGN